jgi:hypothetical protein
MKNYLLWKKLQALLIIVLVIRVQIQEVATVNSDRLLVAIHTVHVHLEMAHQADITKITIMKKMKTKISMTGAKEKVTAETIIKEDQLQIVNKFSAPKFMKELHKNKWYPY